MIETVKLKADHLMQLLEQDITEIMLKPHITRESAENLEKQDYTFTCISKLTGKIVFCGGVTEYWKNRGEAWAILNKGCTKEFIGVHNATRRLFEVCPIRRIEAAVEVDFMEGHRWVRALGFKMEAERLRAYTIDGRDVSLYARIT